MCFFLNAVSKMCGFQKIQKDGVEFFFIVTFIVTAIDATNDCDKSFSPYCPCLVLTNTYNMN